MDPVLLFTVEDVFQIAGRGCVLVPGLSAEQGSQAVQIGDRLRLRRPDGRCFETSLKGVEMIRRLHIPEFITAPILLPQDITKDDVPIGTEVWFLTQANFSADSAAQRLRERGLGRL